MLDYAVNIITHLPPLGVLLFVCFITFAENVFPPSPSDTILVFCGTLIGLGTVGFPSMLLSSTLGSTVGFVVMYWIGQRYGTRIIESDRIKFMPKEAAHKAEAWFRHYGYWVIIANRFLSGTRAVISMVAGLSEMPLGTTAALSAVSAAVWNAILLFAGFTLGKNWTQMDDYLQLYGKILLSIAVVALVFFLVIRAWQQRKKNSQNNSSQNKSLF